MGKKTKHTWLHKLIFMNLLYTIVCKISLKLDQSNKLICVLITERKMLMINNYMLICPLAHWIFFLFTKMFNYHQLTQQEQQQQEFKKILPIAMNPPKSGCVQLIVFLSVFHRFYQNNIKNKTYKQTQIIRKHMKIVISSK